MHTRVRRAAADGRRARRSIYLRENASGLYSTSAYYLGRTLAEAPLHSFFAFLTCAVWYVPVVAFPRRSLTFVWARAPATR
jgi:hypothetical protein